MAKFNLDTGQYNDWTPDDQKLVQDPAPTTNVSYPTPTKSPNVYNDPAPPASQPSNDLGTQLDDYFKGRGVSMFPTSRDYWIGKKPELDARGREINNPNYFWDRVAQADEFGGGHVSGTTTTVGPGFQAPAYGGSNPFDDPATKQFIDLLNQRIGALNTPANNPDVAPLQDYLRKYFQQLQQPVYTDQQRDLLNTQVLDPMERQRQARKQQALTQMAAHGMGPNDGPTIDLMNQIDRQFDQSRTQTQGQIATNEIGLGQQNQAKAASVGSDLANLSQGIFNQQDQRENQAVSLAKTIPDLAQQRMSQAIQLLSGSTVNPASLLSSQQGFQQQGMNQNANDAQFWQSLLANISKIFGL